MYRAIILALILLPAIEARTRCIGCQRGSNGRIARSSSAKHEFRRGQPCPSTGQKIGACPGYVIDHKIALACGGIDAPRNMQWQTAAEARAKDRVERRGCRG